MSRRREAGFALILVLILVAVGSLVLIPAIQLSTTAVKSSDIAQAKTRAMYAIDGAHEYVMWKLLHDDFGSTFSGSGAESGEFTLDACGQVVTINVAMQAIPGGGGLNLVEGDAVVRPMKTVEVVDSGLAPGHSDGADVQLYEYIIRLEQLSTDLEVAMEAVYDILPDGFRQDTFIGQSWISTDDQATWQEIPEGPGLDGHGGQIRLVWPKLFDIANEAGTGFSSHVGVWEGFGDFQERQVKYLKFQVGGPLPNNTVQCNWVVLRPWGTVSGPQAAVIVGEPTESSCKSGGLLTTDKTAVPNFIEPGTPTDIKYTITITNDDWEPHQIVEITDYLPPGFTYLSTTDEGDFIEPPVLTELVEVSPDVWRVLVRWEPASQYGTIAGGATKTLVFWGHATSSISVSGSYYNEVITVPGPTAFPPLFGEITTADQYFKSYSWNTGAVMVPSYDSTASSDGVTINANLSFIIGSITITSYQVR